MCAFLGAAIGAAGSLLSGVLAMQSANYQAAVARNNAEAAVREGFAQAGATRDQFAEVRGAQAAALAKSGVDINSGTSAVLGLETQRREEVAAAVDIWRGRTEQTKWLNQEKVAKTEGKAAMIGGVLNAFAGLAGGLGGQGQGRPLQLGQAGSPVRGAAFDANRISPRRGNIPV